MLPHQEFGSPTGMKQSIAQLPFLGANTEAGPLECATLCSAVHCPEPCGQLPAPLLKLEQFVLGMQCPQAVPCL